MSTKSLGIFEQAWVVGFEDGEEVLFMLEQQIGDLGVGVLGVAQHNIESPGIVGNTSFEEAESSGILVFTGSDRLEIHEDWKVLAEQHGVNVLVIILNAVAVASFDVSLSTSRTASLVRSRGFVSVDCKSVQSIACCRQSLVALDL